jgi:hypothetical protein
MADVRERQAALPGVIEAQEIGQVGAVGVKAEAFRITGAERVGGMVDALGDGAAVRLPDGSDELAIAALVGGRSSLRWRCA